MIETSGENEKKFSSFFFLSFYPALYFFSSFLSFFFQLYPSFPSGFPLSLPRGGSKDIVVYLEEAIMHDFLSIYIPIPIYWYSSQLFLVNFAHTGDLEIQSQNFWIWNQMK